jgi:hypothetical protein
VSGTASVTRYRESTLTYLDLPSSTPGDPMDLDLQLELEGWKVKAGSSRLRFSSC